MARPAFTRGDFVTLDGFPGIAWVVTGPHMGVDYDGDEFETSLVNLHMVGDDRNYCFDMSELTALDDDEFCHQCGQIGCQHG